VATKPIGAGRSGWAKWFGLLRDAGLARIAGACIYGQLILQARKLDFKQQEVCRNESSSPCVAGSRASGKIDARGEAHLQERVQKNPVSKADLGEVMKQIREGLRPKCRVCRPVTGGWRIDLGVHVMLRDNRCSRVKFNAAEKVDGHFRDHVEVGEPDKSAGKRISARLAPDTFHEIQIPAELV